MHVQLLYSKPHCWAGGKRWWMFSGSIASFTAGLVVRVGACSVGLDAGTDLHAVSGCLGWLACLVSSDIMDMSSQLLLQEDYTTG